MNWGLIWAAVTAIGTVFAGLALPLAFIQLGALRQDRLREQVSKVGVWTDKPHWTGEAEQWHDRWGTWVIPVLIRNGSELPVRVDAVDLTLQVYEFGRISVAADGTSKPEYFGHPKRVSITPGTVAPGESRSEVCASPAETAVDQELSLMASITRVVITDAAGYQWETRSGQKGPARRVRQLRRW